MRGWFLLLLGAGLGYYGWRQLGGEPVVEGLERQTETVEGSTGRLRPVGEFLNDSAPTQTLGAPLLDAGVGDPPPKVASGAKAPEIGSLDVTWSFGDPVEQGRVVLHATETVPAYLERQTQLSRSRRALLFAYACLVKGLKQQAAEHLAALEEAGDVSRDELEHLRRGIEGRRIEPGELRGLLDRPLLLGLTMGRLAEQAAVDERAGRYPDAARAYSGLVRAELDAPWDAHRPALRTWAASLSTSQAHHRWNRRGEWASFEVEVQRGDTLVAIRKRVVAERPELRLCTGLIDRVNQLGGRALQPGQRLRIPTDRVHTLVDLGAFITLYMHGEEVVAAWEVATGRDNRTAPGVYVAGDKIPEPPWFPPGRPSVPYGSPENPLGTRWIAWEGSDSLGFHGTREPETIGTAASDGCIRMRNPDVEELFEILPVGAEVVVRP